MKTTVPSKISLPDKQSLKATLESAFSEIVFDEEQHRYTMGEEEYIGVSALINEFSSGFDAHAISERVAKRKPMSAKALRTMWSTRREYSTVRGTEFHRYVETYLRENYRLPIQTPIHHQVKEFHHFWRKNKERYELIAMETIVAHHELKLAGTFDCLVRLASNGRFYLLDWKTNQAIRETNQHQLFRSPLDHLQESDVNKYALQSSLYKFLLEDALGIAVQGVFLVHFPPSGTYRIIGTGCEPSLPNMHEEVQKILAFRRQSLQGH